MVETMSTKSKRKLDRPETEVEITDEMRALLANFTPEEIATGTIQTGRPPSNGSHTIHDLKSAFQEALLEKTIGGMLRALRERHQHSHTDTAQALGVTRARSHQLEQPGTNLRIDTLQRYASAYGYKVQVALVPDDDDEQTIITELPEVAPRPRATRTK